MKGVPFLLASLIGGAIMALLSNIPLISALNCLLCLWMWVGGILAVVFYRMFDKEAGKINPGQGVLLGLTAGVIGGLLNAIVSMIQYRGSIEAVTSFLQSNSDVWNAVSPYVGMIPGSGIAGATCMFIFYVIFGMLGGLLGAAISRGGKQVAAEWDATFDAAPPVTSVFDAPAVVQTAEKAQPVAPESEAVEEVVVTEVMDEVVEPLVEEAAPPEPEEPADMDAPAADEDVPPADPAA